MTDMVERYEDMSPSGRLRLHEQDDGDVIIEIVPDPHDAKHYTKSVEFCMPYTGGGKSFHTHKALLELKRAIERDNTDRPQHRD